MLVYAGTYTERHPFGSRLGRAVRNLLSAGRRRSLGIYALRYDPTSGGISRIDVAARTDNPSWLALHPTGRFLYAVNEADDGAVSAFAVDADSGGLTPLNRVSTRGASPCHIAVDGGGRCAYVANYGSGTVSVHPIGEDGAIGESADIVRHYGSSVHRQRQTEPHPHCVAISTDDAFALVPDLGTDRIMVYRVDPLSGRLEGNDPPFAAASPGQGPRHAVFHPGGDLVYAVNELGSTVTSFRFDRARGALERAHNVSTLPDGWRGDNTAADLHVHPRGHLLFASNRGHDSIVTFEIDEEGGMRRLAVTRSGGRTPRGFTLDPAGSHLLVAHQASDHLVSFRIEEKSGDLEQVWEGRLPSGVCLAFRRG
jgi:6-phosphogluconolactonase